MLTAEALLEENESLRQEIVRMKQQHEQELIIAKASVISLRDELDAVRDQLRQVQLRTLVAEDDSFYVRDEAAKIIAKRI